MTAGSKPNFDAITGKAQPTSLAVITVKNKVKHTTKATIKEI